MTQKINESNFETEVLRSSQPVLVAFYASWCRSRRLMNMIDQFNKELGGVAKVVKVDVEESPNLASQFDISNLPYFAIVEHGKVVRDLSQYKQKATA